ncbi:MAG: hypothetical protein R3F42_15680 [Pseudomonadota bacterium]
MQIRTVLNGTRRTLKIWVCETLDVQLHAAFANTAVVANYTLIDDIEIDLQHTRVIRDSGLALLMMLQHKCARHCSRIRLVNCSEELRSRLLLNNLAGHFQIA